MGTLALAAAAPAHLAVAVLAARLHMLALRAESVVARLARLADSEAGAAVHAWRDAARGVQGAAGKVKLCRNKSYSPQSSWLPA